MTSNIGTHVTQDTSIQAVKNLIGKEVSAFLERVLKPLQSLDLVTDKILPEGMLSYIDIRTQRQSVTLQIKILVVSWMSRELVVHTMDKVGGNSVIQFIYDQQMYNTAQAP